MPPLEDLPAAYLALERENDEPLPLPSLVNEAPGQAFAH